MENEVKTQSVPEFLIAVPDENAPVQIAPRRPGKARQYGDLPARPIMIYPQSEAQRAEFEAAAADEQRKLSPFIVWVVTQYIQHKRMAVHSMRSGDTIDGRLAEAKRRLSLRAS